ncbi:MAG: FkbM family methyltransferase [Pseudoxanthomonas sp.]|nr:FkbM family methyltransferase [Pseudoxanthomonas sp.]
MQPHLSLATDAAGANLQLALHACPDHCDRLDIGTRDGTRRLHAPLLRDGDGGARAVVPLAALGDEMPLRWDVRLGDADGTRTHLRPAPRSDRPRHFFRAVAGAHGVSAYLSDTIGSLVLLSAPRDHHAAIANGEDARADFPRLLEELPLQEDLVLFESFLGKQYAGNPRYIYEALRRRRPDLRCVWAYSGKTPIPGDPPTVRRGSAEYFRLLAQARYRVNNVLFDVPGRKPETTYLQTWHGTPLKRLGRDIEIQGPETEARGKFHRESRGWSVLLSGNEYSTGIFRRAFDYDGPVLEAGYPLVDPLLDPAPDRAALAARLGLPAGRRFVLYAPTWRDHRPVGTWRFDFDLNLDLDAVSAALAPDQVLLVKAHHLVAGGTGCEELPPNVLDVSHLDDISELCALADVLVTDYSSVFFDFAASGRPILFYCYDLEQYAGQVRGFYLDPETELPGPIARTTAELLELLGDLPAVVERHAERYAAFRERFCSRNDGRAAERVVDAVFGPAPPPAALLVDLTTAAGRLQDDEAERLQALLRRYAPYAGTISSLLYEKLPAAERARFLVWFLKRWAGIDRVDAAELAAYQADAARIAAEPREPVEVDGRRYTLQDLRSQGHDFRLATYEWVLGIHDILYDQYQTDGFRVRPGDVVIDAGGFVGDTAALFCAKTGGDCQVHAFELLDENIALFAYNNALNGIADRVQVNRLALSDRSGDEVVIRQARLQGATSVAAGDGPGERIATITLDDYVAGHGLERVDLIKMDIEGSEIPALKGAMQTIRRFRPMLALCLYHKWDDVLTIPRFIAATGVEYRFNFKWVQLTHGWEAVLLASPVEPVLAEARP